MEDHLSESNRISQIRMESINGDDSAGKFDEKLARDSVSSCWLSPRTIDSSTKTHIKGASDIKYLMTCTRYGKRDTFSINITLMKERTSQSQKPRHVSDHRMNEMTDVIGWKSEQVPRSDAVNHTRTELFVSIAGLVCVVAVVSKRMRKLAAVQCVPRNFAAEVIIVH